MKHFFRSPIFWVGSTIISVLLILFALKFFSQAFPIVNLDLTMDRTQALAYAKKISTQHKLGPDQYQQATSFVTDHAVKTFVELEGGGKDAFVDIMKRNLYEPYTWQVRHFKEFEKNETLIIFTPNGKPYGFVETISEDAAGANLESSKAQSIAKQAATEDWHVDLTQYKLVETDKEVRPSGRSDHAFVYERPEKIGEGHYRLRLVVSGEKLTQLTHFVKVPENFVRRYQQMRSTNIIIAWAANLVMNLLYLIGGCIIGLFFLFRKNWVIWRTPLLCGVGISSLLVLANLNQLPLMWMAYNTAHTMNGFLLRQLVAMLFIFLMQSLFFAVVFAAAETLTRKAFGHHPQLWRIWSAESASSWAIIGRTLGGYLLIGFDFAFVILFYLITTRYFNWWIPSSSLFNPNILATYFPWLSSIAISLNAAFVEECLFRAVPLAGAALLGKRFGKQKLWISAAFILQAVIFGAAHASYPTQPAFARLVELIIPSFAWGAIYLGFGLLPTIISHFVYDVIWFALPIFVSSAPRAYLHQGAVIFLALIPLWIILYARLKIGRWTTLPANAINAAWQPPTPIKPPIRPTQLIQTKTTVSPTVKNIIIACGVIGLLAWALSTPFVQHALPLTSSRTTVIQQAKKHLHQQNITLAHPWQTLPSVFTHYETNRPIELQHRFIWQHGGKDMYKKLFGTYLIPAHWIIRFAQFEGDIVARSEEYHLFLRNGTIFHQRHKLPETQPGAQLAVDQSRLLAHDALKTHFGLTPETLQEISAIAQQQPERKDWVFIFSNPVVYSLDKGQARIKIRIAGDQIIDAYQYIHVPEEWERSEQNKQNNADILKMLCALLLTIIFVSGSAIALRQWTQHAFSYTHFLSIFASILALNLFNSANTWPLIMAMFNTSAPFINQVIQVIGAVGLQAFIGAAVLALMITFITQLKTPRTLAKNTTTYLLGTCVGLFIAGLESLTHWSLPSLQPTWANYSALGTYLPVNAAINGFVMQYIVLTLLILLLCAVVDYGTQHWQQRRLPFAFLFVLFGLMLNGILSLNDISTWLITGSVMGSVLCILYHVIIRFDHAIIPLATGSYLILHAIQQGAFNAYPGAIFVACTNIIVVGFLGTVWFRKLNV